MRVLSLFDGISCGMIALERAGIDVELYDAYEIDENAIKISKQNYSKINHKGNVYEASYKEHEYDLLIGGSPCTYWSIAKGKGREVSEGVGYDLFCQYVRALKEVKPTYFLYENNHSIHPNIKKLISNALGVEPIMLNSSLVSAQSRKRCYWTNIPFKTPNDKKIILSDVVNWDAESWRPVGKWCYTKWGDKLKIDTLCTTESKKSATLTTSGTHYRNYYLNKDKTMYCNLTIKDWERLQTLPIGYVDNVDISKGAKYKAIGNGWTIDIIVSILQGI